MLINNFIMKKQYNSIFTLIAFVIVIAFAIFQSLRLMNLKVESQQYMKLAEAEDLFIRGEIDSAFMLYKTIELDRVDDEFLNLRMEVAELVIVAEDGDNMDYLKNSLVAILSDCSVVKESSILLKVKSFPELISLMKECYKETRTKKEIKVSLIDQLSRIKYLNFTNGRGHNIHYLGTVVDSMATGEGVGIWSDESFYRGQWHNNKREGYGYFKTAKGEVYEGYYENDRRNGEGTYFFRNGDYYTGEWTDGERCGFGTVISASGDTLVHGFFERDRFDRRKTRAYKESKNSQVDEEPTKDEKNEKDAD